MMGNNCKTKLIVCEICGGKFSASTIGVCFNCQTYYCGNCNEFISAEDFKGNFKQFGNSCAKCREIKKVRFKPKTKDYLSSKLRFFILQRDNFTCQYCGRSAPDVVLQVDHKFPTSKGGLSIESNLVTACQECNRGKSNTVCSFAYTCV